MGRIEITFGHKNLKMAIYFLPSFFLPVFQPCFQKGENSSLLPFFPPWQVLVRALEHLPHLCQRFPFLEEDEQLVHPKGLRNETPAVFSPDVELGV